MSGQTGPDAPEPAGGPTAPASGSTTSTRSMTLISLRRKLPCMERWRSSEYLTAAASSFSPSWNMTPGRSLMTRLVGSIHS